jgi:hypothetical protein
MKSARAKIKCGGPALATTAKARNLDGDFNPAGVMNKHGDIHQYRLSAPKRSQSLPPPFSFRLE